MYLHVFGHLDYIRIYETFVNKEMSVISAGLWD